MLLAAAMGSLTIPNASFAQPAQQIRRIGYLSLGKSESEVAKTTRTLYSDALRRVGWEEGRNLVIERRYAEGDASQLDGLAKELVTLKVVVIMASLNTAIAAAKRATSDIAIVMTGATQPVEVGLVQSLGRPGGNVTGTMVPSAEYAGKSLEIVKEIAPALTRLAILFNPGSPGVQSVNAARIRAAAALGMTVQEFIVTKPDDIAAALDRIAASRAEVLLVSYDGVTESRLREITDFATKNRIISIGTVTLFTTVGGAIYYGSNIADIVNRGASYVDRILRGAKPADLPVEQPTKFDLIINLKTMREIGLNVPRSVLMRADELIE
jgi:putative tryptophan/tyrosine transport system substrate-binding protein